MTPLWPQLKQILLILVISFGMSFPFLHQHLQPFSSHSLSAFRPLTFSYSIGCGCCWPASCGFHAAKGPKAKAKDKAKAKAKAAAIQDTNSSDSPLHHKLLILVHEAIAKISENPIYENVATSTPLTIAQGGRTMPFDKKMAQKVLDVKNPESSFKCGCNLFYPNLFGLLNTEYL